MPYRVRNSPRRRTSVLARSKLAAVSVALGLVAAGGAAATADQQGRGLSATVRYTEFGVPHIVANSYRDLGFGQGYAAATDNMCSLAQTMLTTSATRSKYLGGDAPLQGILAAGQKNLVSDVYFQGINDSGIVERLVAHRGKLGPAQEVRDAVSGYAAGVNQFLRENRNTDPGCKGAAWLRPMTEIDIYRHMYASGMAFGQGSAAGGIVSAAAPGSTVDNDGDLGSNAISLGSQATANGKGISLANPHLPWNAPDIRLWQSHLTIPGRLNASGAGVVGLPLLWLGHTETMAWAGTAADTTRTFTLFELKLVPGSPTKYLVDGRPEPMTRRDVTVAVAKPGGGTENVTRTQWSTRYGPIVQQLGEQKLPWTAETAFAMADANAQNMRMGNSTLKLMQARSTDEAMQGLKETQGLPWMNIFVTDSRGKASYHQLHVVPNVTDARAAECNTELGKRTYPERGIAVLDGSRSNCGWGQDRDAVQPGTFGPGSLPSLSRADYLENSNDSYWLTNARQPITGFSRILGTAETSRSHRTRMGLTAIEEQLAKGKFSKESLQELMFSNRNQLAELAVDDLVRLCRTMSADLKDACDTLSTWDRKHDVESRGALLFDRFWTKLRTSLSGPAQWKVPFDLAKPITTPNTLNTDHPDVAKALAHAVAELRAANIPVNAPWGDNHYVVRNGERIPIGGGQNRWGVFNSISGTWDPAKGYTEMVHGATYLHALSFNNSSCPDSATLMAYSQSSNPASPHYSDQTKLYSRKQWVTERFCEKDIMASPNLRVVEVRQR
ncbi:penicillin acylase family protein [Allokutzneria sp. A3M-2-11 16]|uniref:penicillin acylase family protein n=1 Tax=Allokutzneria sp. A3M-2-11 16 TaxID=2962043 RepID=UPI0020B75B5C|nr:penicillin acylase family protein [Allokutzneria sp. A3M-2-11 16]MCP3801881.1 penicillin acylase family protein [Allokutzneria sp. A3M-2-11 16]